MSKGPVTLLHFLKDTHNTVKILIHKLHTCLSVTTYPSISDPVTFAIFP